MESIIPKRRVLFDLTRLIERRNTQTATDIDRVDLQYARFVLQGDLGQPEFIAQQGGTLVTVSSASAKRLLETLEKRWFFGERIAVPSDVAGKCITKDRAAVRSDETRGAHRRDDIASYFRRMSLDRRLRVAKRICFGGALPKEFDWIKEVSRFRRLFVVVPALASRKSLLRLREVQQHIPSEDAPVQSGKDELWNHIDVRPVVQQVDRVVYVNASHHGPLKIDSLADLFVASELEILCFVHDLIPVEYPEYIREGEDVVHKNRIDAILSLQPKLVVSSQATRGSVLGWCADRDIQPPEIHVAYIGVDNTEQDASMVSAEIPSRKYFVCVGAIAPGKNHLLLLTIWRQLVDELGDGAPLLVIIGGRDGGNQNVFNFLDRSKKLQDYVIELGEVADAHMHKLMMGARAVLFPAFAEGGGRPIVEALAGGVPVIASDLPILREVGQDVPDFIDPKDGVGWENAIKEYTKDGSRLRHGQLQRLSRFKRPTWDEHFLGVKGFVTKEWYQSEENARTLSACEE